MSERTGLEIAVIGMSARFPDAENIQQFWENLANGVESVSFLTDEELEELGVAPELADNRNYVRSKGSVLQEREYFDASFFDYTPREAEIMDPQMRIFHECTWEALENAGYYPKTYDGLIGLYAGATCSSYWEVLTFLSGRTDELGTFLSGHLNNKDFLSTRIAYKLDLKGPAFTVHAACATSLVAIHLACQALLNGECHMALAGGVTVSAQEGRGYLFQEGMVLSRDGHCRAFDAEATGFIGGSGAGVVVLKALEDAVAHRDHIYAVIKSTAINNDGIRKVGFTAPSTEGQADVIRVTLKVAQVEPETIGYIEAHGTGTELGDLVELEALKLAFNTDKKRFCAVGSVKTNIGHTDSAAGVAGFIKTVLALNHKMIPPSLNFETPNPRFDFENSPFYVNTKLRQWENGKYPLRAGVSSFGIGGTNAHVILEEGPPGSSSNAERTAQSAGREYQLILLSAKTPTALERMTRNLADHSRKNPGINLADAAYTLQVGRGAFQHRSMLVCSTTAETIEALSTPDTVKVKTGQIKTEETPVIFMLSGLGSQYMNMGLELYQKESLFRREMDRCFEILDTLLDDTIKEILYPGEAAGAQKNQDRGIDSFDIAQVVTFIFGYALAKLLIKWGIKPYAMIGYSFGEYTAACISGVLALEDALKLIVLRGKLINKLPPGAMLSVPLTRDQLKPFLSLHHELSLAIDNGPSCIVAGPKDAAAAFEGEMKKNGCMCMRLQASRAIHSTMMEPILKEFEAAVGRVVLNEPQIPYISNVTGDWLTKKDAASPGYWAVHLKETVLFADGIEELAQVPNAVFIEVGPGRDLTALITRHLEDNPGHRAVNIVRHPTQKVSDLSFLLNRIGRAWLLGVEIDWQAFHANEERYRLPLPTYSFDRQPYKIEGDTVTLGVKRFTYLDQTRRKPDIADWFYIPSWKRLDLTADKIDRMPDRACWLLFIDAVGLGAQLAKQLEKKGQQVITVQAGTAFLKESEQQFSINPHRHDDNDYDTLFSRLKQQDMIPDRIIHLWGITGSRNKGADIESAEQTQDTGFYSLIYIARAIDRQQVDKKMQIKVITDNMHEVIGSEGCCPAKATVLGPVRVIPAEYPNISCRSIDVVLANPGIIQEEELIDQLLNEFCAESEDPIVAFRANHRWVQSFEPTRLEEAGKNKARLGPEGVYLIIGGLGYLGLTLAQYLAANVKKAKLVLTGRSQFPPKNQWEQYLNNSPGDHAIKQKILKVQKLEKLGAEVMILSADVSNRQQMDKVISEVENRFGRITGMIHSAGELDSCMIQHKTRAAAEKSLAAKVKGAPVLYEIFKNTKLDFFVLFSSLRSFLPAPGTVGQVAASNFFDYFANYYSKKVDFPVISINWDGWHNVDLPAETGRSRGSIVPRKGTEVFHRILGDRFSQVAVSASDLWRKIQLTRNWDETEDAAAAKDNQSRQKPLNENLYQRPQLDTEYIAPRNQTEKVLADIWTGFFGFEKVGTHDDFFELGGDSLKAIMVIARIHKELEVEVPLPVFFQHLNIQNLAEYIDNNAGSSVFSAIRPVEEKDYYVLSPAQKRLYILQQLDKDSIGYNETQAVHILGNIDKAKFARTFHELIKRHETFRTSFELVSGEPVQKVNDPRDIEFSLEYYDAEKLAEGEEYRFSPLKIEEIIENFIRPFDLGRAPLLRAELIKQGKDSHILVIDRHHLVTDALANDIFMNNFMAIWAGEELPPLKLQYKDYAGWRLSREVQDSLKPQEEYWLKEFSGEIPVLNLPYDYTRPAIQSYEGSVIRFQLSEEETRKINEMTSSAGATLFMVLLALYSILLSKLSSQEEIVVGTPVAGRRHTDLEQIIGVFINTLPLRTFPSGEKTLTLFLQEVKNRTLEAFENQDFPFEELVDTVMVERNMSRNPLFDIMFTLYSDVETNEDVSGEKRHGLEIKPYSHEVKSSKFDLTLTAFENRGGLCFTFEYCTKLFRKKTIVKFVGYFKRVISSALENPHKKISNIEIITGEEKKQILFDFNNTTTEYPNNKTIHQLFEEQVQRTPDHNALAGPCIRTGVIPDSIQITYDELNQKSNRLALLLIEKGVRPDTIVGIMMERSIEMIIGIFGILKAGGAYLPIELDYPEDRIEFMLRDSEVRILINQNQSEKNIPLEGKIIKIDIKDIYYGKRGNFKKINTPEDTAYVIYTSGTTGKPKGVAVEHGNVIIYLNAFFNEFEITSKCTILQQASYSFDTFAEEIYPVLLMGGKIQMPPKDVIMDIHLLSEFIAKNNVNMISCSPLLLNELNKLCLINNIHTFISGGDVLKGEYINNFLKISNVYNSYGPTETTVCATYYKCLPGMNSSIYLGKPISNYKVYILDQRYELLPEGVPGELCISGPGVTRGYLNRPELTAEKFKKAVISHSSLVISSSNKRLSKSTNDRLYCTGDLARWRDNGNIEFLGRIDSQVKIRGFRIELGEIESQLLNHNEIENAIVISKEDESANKHLCTYIVSGKELTISGLREYLSKELPDYMIPSYFVQVEKIPLTPNGKIDRRALDSYDVKMGTGVEYVEPKDKIEQMIADTWKEVLKLDKIGIHDNFFDLGGNSLYIIAVNRKLQDVIGKDIPVVKMFRYPTIDSFIKYLRQDETRDLLSDRKIAESVNIMEETMNIFLGEENG